MQENSSNDDKASHQMEPLLQNEHNATTTVQNCYSEETENVTAIPMEKSPPQKITKKPDYHSVHHKPPTTFLETLIHTVKGNLGGGAFAMGDAFKNAGLLLGPILTIILGAICIYGNHLLVSCSEIIRDKKKLTNDPSFPETIELCFENGPIVFRRWTPIVRLTVKVFIVVTQLGFCCVYFVFVSSTAQTVLKSFDINYDVKIYMAIMFFPVLLTCLIRSLKFLTPISLLSNTCLLSGIVFTLYLSCSDFPPISERRLYSSLDTLPLFFGTIIYSFEGIALVIPLKNEMKEQKKFAKPLGVLNIGMGIIMCILISLGTIGYWKYGDAVEGSLSLNLDKDDVKSQIVQTVVGVGIMFSYALQLYVAAELLWDEIDGAYGPFKHPVALELILRCVLVLITFILAASIPALGLFISLVGAVSSSALALVYPALSDIALRTCPEAEGPLRTKDQFFRFVLDGVLLLVALFGFTFGSFYSIGAILEEFKK